MIPESERKNDLEAQTLFQKARVGRVYGPLTDGFPVKVDFTEFGRAVFATDDIYAGKHFRGETSCSYEICVSCCERWKQAKDI